LRLEAGGDGKLVAGTELDRGTVEFAEAGGISPDAAVENSVSVEPEVENVTAPDETVMFGGDVDVEFGRSELRIPVETGVMMPSDPVDKKVAVDPEVVLTIPPEETITLTLIPEVDTANTLLEMFEDGSWIRPDEELAGGMTPPPSVDVKVRVLLPIVMFALPSDTDSELTTELLDVGFGGIWPAEPVLLKAEMAPDVVETKEPTDTVTMGVGELPGSVEFDTAWMVCGAKLLDAVSIDGMIIPSELSAVIVEVAPETVRLADPTSVRGLVEFAGYVQSVVLDPGP
tara:strand:+ start:30849 stop:31706 length:858 start_codon:yes stop_codon:yes gene_type:complete